MIDILLRAGEWILERVVPAGPAREGLLGDLAELAKEKARTRGRMRAGLWYVEEVAWALARYAPTRIAGALGLASTENGPVTGGGEMVDLGKDVVLAVRRLWRTPGFTLTVAATVGLGIGANTTVFSVVRGVLLRPLPFPKAERIVSVYETTPDINMSAGWGSVPNFVDWRASASSFGAMALFRGRSASIGTDERPRYVYGAFVTSDFFRVFGVEPELGRGFTERETGPDAGSVVVIGQGLWQRGFGGDPEILGRTVRLDGNPMRVVGVMPSGFDAPGSFIGSNAVVDVWRPFPLDPASAAREDRSYNVVARLADGRTLDDARREMQTVASRLAGLHPEANGRWTVHVQTWQDLVVGPFRPAIALLMGLVLLVLVVTCANVANLMTSRAVGRETEMATMVALGAGRARVLRELLVEALVLAALGSAVGLLLAAAGVHLFRAYEPGLIPRLDAVRVDGMVLAFGLAASLGSGVAFGGAAAAAVATRDPARALAAARTGGGAPRRRLRWVLAAGQLATAFALLTAAGLLTRSFLSLRAVNLGFATEEVTAATVALSWNRVPDRARRTAFVAGVLSKLRSTPGIESAAMINSLPLSGSMQQLPVRVQGAGSGEDQEVVVSLRASSPEYPATMGIPVVDGRDFSSADVDDPNTVLINQTLAKRFWPDVSPLGSTIVFADRTTATIVGVLGDVRHHGPQQGPRPEVYRPYSTDVLTSKSFVVRSHLPDDQLRRLLEDVVAGVDPEQPVREVRSMGVWADLATASFRFEAGLVAVAASLAVALAAVGLFATLAGMVSEGRREIALRLALGACGADILAELGRRVGRLVAMGLACGVVLTVPLGLLLRGFLYGVDVVDPTVLAGGLVACLVISALAAAVPARRALALEPARTLREE